MRDYIASISWFPSGIFDFDGNILYDWLYDDRYYGEYFTVNEGNLFDVGIGNDGAGAVVNGFNKTGNFLNNFPISVRKERGQDSLIFNSIRVFDGADGQKNIAVLAGDYNFDWDLYAKKDLTMYLDIYNLDGGLVKRTKLFESSRHEEVRGGALLLADLNNDGQQEIVVSFGILDFDLYRAGEIFNLDTFRTMTFVFDGKGEIISTPYEIKGYLISKLAVGQFSDGTPSIVMALSDTFPTTYNGQKIVAFDYLGNKRFDVNLPDSNDMIQGLVIGDVDSDGQSEVIINYRPRWFDGGNSGIKIFSGDGLLEKEIKIGTTGEVDDLWGDPILADFNGDGKIDLIQQSWHNTREWVFKTRIYAISLGGKYDKDKLDWPMFEHDPQHTGCFDCEKVKLPPQPPRPQSKIVNNGLADANGNLTMGIQRLQNISWTDYERVYNKEISVPSEGLVKLDALFNILNVNLTSKGRYKVYAEFLDKSASYEFDVK